MAFLIRRAQLQERGEWSVKDEECVHHIKAVQHAELRRMVAEEMSRVQSGEQVSKEELAVLQKLVKEAGELENQLTEHQVDEKRRRIKSLTKKVEEEVLQTRIVPLDEVRRNPEEWKEACRKEYDTLTSGPGTPISAKEVEDLKRNGQEIEMLPMKAIASKKPPAKYKGRWLCVGIFRNRKKMRMFQLVVLVQLQSDR